MANGTVTQDGAGWTVVTQSTGKGDKIIYVSDSGGNDANNGLTTGTPVKTLVKGYSLLTANSGDWLLLKCGDSFTNQPLFLGNVPGRSASEPILIGTYGTGARPKVLSGVSDGTKSFYPYNLVLKGLYFEAQGRTSGDNADVYGINWYAPINVIIEDCYVTGYRGNIQFPANLNGGSNVTVRRCISVDAGSAGANNQGLYANQVNGLLIEENLFDNNGQGVGSQPNILDHCIYLSYQITNVTIRRNILSRAPGIAIKSIMTGGPISVTDNLITHNGFQGGIGSSNQVLDDGATPSGQILTFNNNVITEGLPITANGGTYGDGSGPVFANVASGTISNNVIANLIAGDAYAEAHSSYTRGSITLTDDARTGAYGIHNVTVSGNVIYNYRTSMRIQQPTGFATITGVTVSNNKIQEPNHDYPGFDNYAWMIKVGDSGSLSGTTFSNNTYYRSGSNQASMFTADNGTTNLTFAQWQAAKEASAVNSQVTFTDPTRTTVTYAAGLGTNFLGLIAAMRGQSQANWSTALTAPVINNYIRVGFDLSALVQAPTITSNGQGATATIQVVAGTTAVTTVTVFGDPTITFTKSGTNAALFSLDSAGVLAFLSAAVLGTYAVTVTVANTAGSDSQDLTVIVTSSTAPTITSLGGGTTAIYTLPEGGKSVATCTATGTLPITWDLPTGADKLLFAIDSAGVLTFVTAPVYLSPTDANADNVYIVGVRASNASGTYTQTISITVTQIAIGGPGVSFLRHTSAIPATGNQITANITVAGPSPALLIGVGIKSATASVTAPSWSLGGGNPYLVKAVINSADCRTEIWAIPAPAIGAGTLTIGLSASVPSQADVVCFTNADQTTPCPLIDAVATSAIAANTEGVLTPTHLNSLDASFGAGALTISGDPVSGYPLPNQIFWNNTTAVNLETGYATGTTGVTFKFTTTNNSAAAVRIVQASQAVAPTITSNGGGLTASISMLEGRTDVTTIVASSGLPTVFSVQSSPGTDYQLFAIDSVTGALTFRIAPSYASPRDLNGDNVYVVLVTATNTAGSDGQTISVTVTSAPITKVLTKIVGHRLIAGGRP